MKVHFDVSVEDCIAMTERFIRTSPGMRSTTARPLFVLVILMFFLPLGAIWISDQPWDTAMSLSPLAAPLILIALVRPMRKWTLRRGISALVKNAELSGALGANTIETRPEFLVCSNSICESRFHWSAVKSLGLDANRLYIVLTTGTGYVIPRTAFASEAALQDFSAELQRFSGKPLT